MAAPNRPLPDTKQHISTAANAATSALPVPTVLHSQMTAASSHLTAAVNLSPEMCC